MKHWRCYIAYITIFLVPLDSYKILVFNPHLGTSHVRFVGKIADTLVQAGHNVTQLAPMCNPLVNTNGSKLAKTITINAVEIFKKFNIEEFVQDAWKQKQQSLLAMMFMFRNWTSLFTEFCMVQLEHKEIMQELKSAKFDLGIAEFDPCFAGMVELLEIPAYIFVSATGMLDPAAELVGMPNIPSYVPSILTSYTEEMTYFQRAMNLLFMIFSKIWVKGMIAQEQQLFRKLYGEHFIDLKEKIAQVTYVLTNSDPFLDFPKPTIHKVKELGGVSVPEPEPLNEYWTAVMNRRKTVVLVSFGSVALSYLMPNETKQSLLETFDEFPDVTFIWKYEKEEHRIADGHPNVVTGKWVPQTDLLAHPNLVAFMTHGGMNSITEALSRGKPVIVVPLFGDQMRNAVLAQRSGFGTMLAVSELAVKEKVRDAFDRIIHDKSYARKAEQLSKMIARRPNPSKEQLIKHVEFAAEFGQIPNFDPYGRKMSFISYYMLDIILPFLLLVLIIGVGLCYGVFRLFRRLILGSSEGSNNQEKEAKKNK